MAINGLTAELNPVLNAAAMAERFATLREAALARFRETLEKAEEVRQEIKDEADARKAQYAEEATQRIKGEIEARNEKYAEDAALRAEYEEAKEEASAPWKIAAQEIDARREKYAEEVASGFAQDASSYFALNTTLEKQDNEISSYFTAPAREAEEAAPQREVSVGIAQKPEQDIDAVKEFARDLGEDLSDEDIQYALRYGRSVLADVMA
jgi:hypothetical protein